MLRILIADDHPIFREGIKRLIQDEYKSAVVDEAESGQEALAKALAGHWDIVVLDIHFTDDTGLEVLKKVRALRKTLPVIMLSASPEEHYAVRALKAGADAYLTKTLAPSQLIKAIEIVRSGEKYVCPVTARHLITDANRETTSSHQLLSDREMEVLCLFSSGKSLKEIGSILTISEKTVSTYRSRILTKLHLRTTMDLVKYAIDHKIAE